MGYEKLPTRTSYDLAKASDINTLMDNIEVLAGNSGNAPGASIQEIFNNIQCLFYSSYKDLKVKPNASNPNNQVDIEWSELRIENRRTVNKSFTLDITTSGALGLSTGSEAVSTWYAIWAGCNNTGDTVTAWLDPSFTSPTLPSGYTKARYVCPWYNKADGNLMDASYRDGLMMYGEKTVLSSGTATSDTNIDISAYAPTGKVSALIRLFGSSASTSSSYIKGRINGTYRQQLLTVCYGGEYNSEMGYVETDNQIIQYAVSGAHSANVHIYGFKIDI
jgi:hypothetical protein